MIRLISGNWNPAQIIGLILALGFALGMVYAIVSEIICRNREKK